MNRDKKNHLRFYTEANLNNLGRECQVDVIVKFNNSQGLSGFFFILIKNYLFIIQIELFIIIYFE